MLTLPRREVVLASHVSHGALAGTGDQGSRRHTTLTLSEVAIVLVACGVGDDVVSVLDRIAPTIVDGVGAILVNVDPIADATVDVARRWAAQHAAANVTVVRQPSAIGSGGNQKVGLRWALEHGHSIAVLVYGDGARSLCRVDDVLTPMLRGEADAVLAGLSINPSEQRHARPVRGIVGDRVRGSIDRRRTTTAYVNSPASGCRAYNLHRLDLRLVESMSDDGRFDADILRHLRARGRHIVEV